MTWLVCLGSKKSPASVGGARVLRLLVQMLIGPTRGVTIHVLTGASRECTCTVTTVC
jgi:hypothetical protein